MLDNLELNLIEMFASVQGETSLTGLPTVFVRLAACNLRCTWCDTSYSFGRGTPYSVNQILQYCAEQGCQHICITGGEPLLQENVYSLIDLLCEKGYIVSLETGGSLPTTKINPRVTTILDIKCPGSGMSQKNHWKNLSHLRAQDEVKFVLADEKDYAYAKEICSSYQLFQREKPPLLSPVFGCLNPQDLVRWILKDQIPVRLNLQIHKFIWEPNTKGV